MLTINFLPYNRTSIMSLTSIELANIPEKLKCLISVVFHKASFINIDDSVKPLINAGIRVEERCYPSHEYICKIKSACQTTDEFSMKIDEDIFISRYVWEFILTHLDCITDKALLMTPTLSTGIPTVERFIHDVLDIEERSVILKMFNETHIPDLWGARYSSLNIDRPSVWNEDDFYDRILNLEHFYKGIHPIRVNSSCQKFMKDAIIKHKDKIKNQNDYWIERCEVPYLCNSCFVIKSNVWKSIIEDESLYRDPFDEVPINLFMQNNKKQILIIRNANGIHPSYNTVGDYMQTADEVYQILKD